MTLPTLLLTRLVASAPSIAATSGSRALRAGDLALEAPEVRRKLRERFGPGAFDPEEPVVTPQAIFEDPRLIEVALPDFR